MRQALYTVASFGFVLSGLAAFSACQKDTPQTEPPASAAAETEAMPAEEDQQDPEMMAAEEPTEAPEAGGDDAQQLWQKVSGTYRQWTAHTDQPVKGQKPHGAFVQVFYNSEVEGDLGGSGAWPSGSIIVKDNYGKSGDSAGELMSITVMEKNGEWFWAKYAPDGTVQKAGGQDTACNNCHASGEYRDGVITEL